MTHTRDPQNPQMTHSLKYVLSEFSTKLSLISPPFESFQVISCTLENDDYFSVSHKHLLSYVKLCTLLYLKNIVFMHISADIMEGEFPVLVARWARSSLIRFIFVYRHQHAR